MRLKSSQRFSRRWRAAARDAGQGTLEYVGMIAVAAILVIAILQATESVDLAGFFTDQINKVKGGG